VAEASSFGQHSFRLKRFCPNDDASAAATLLLSVFTLQLTVFGKKKKKILVSVGYALRIANFITR